MALFKPETTSTNGFSGICECNIVKVVDKSDMFDWADIYLEVQLLQNGSKYTRSANILGEVEKDAKGIITGGSVIKRMYTFFAAIGCDAGINVQGNWEDENGDEIKDIASYLNEKFACISMPDSPPDSYPYIAYFYKEQPKVPGGKSYTRVFTKAYQNKDENKAKLENDVNWMKSKGYLKEMTDEVENKTQMSGSGLSNL